MRLSSIVILFASVGLNLLIWTQINKPYHLVESSYPIQSFSLNPYKKHQSPFDHITFTEKDLEDDIKVLADKTESMRLYSSIGGLEKVPALAKAYDLQVIASAYLDGRTENNMNEQEVEAVIALAKANKNITHVLVGNETQLKHLIPREELIADLRKTRKKLKTPVSTAESWDYWLEHPELANEVDYIAIHILPYWAGVSIDRAVDYVIEKYAMVKHTFPRKPVMIAETGWPSDGPDRGAAQATVANQAKFFRDFVHRAEDLKISYNVIEAFDQPWKSATEGRAGEHWGILDADRHDKFPITGPVLEDPNWKYWALSSTVLGFLAISLFLFRRPDLHLRGKIFSVIVFLLAIALVIQLARKASDQYMTPNEIAFWTVMVAAQILLAIILLTDALEIADVVGNKPLKRQFLPADMVSHRPPFVSIHVACCKEPPAMVIATIDSLAKLDYPDYEVIVVDNNTPDSALWKPVEARCKELGRHFRFFTLGQWPGFKAGALNYALRQTSPHAKVIGVVDADYIVESNWLKATTPYFEDPEMGVVQAPQEHRDWEHNIFQRMENDEYSGFFRIGMVQRNEHNAIIQHGTMTLIDKDALTTLGGWAEWCICEDAELGLRLLNAGKKTIYLNHAFGHGLVPDSYLAYAKQRFRWAYGAMRILRHYWRELAGIRGNKLSFAQRYQFVKGWLPWIGDALHMVFTMTALVWSAKLIISPMRTDFPEPIFIYPALALVLLRIGGTLWTYTARVKIGKKRTLFAMIAGGSLTHKIAKAVFQGLSSSSQPFYRTPKMAARARLFKAFLSVIEEFGLAVSLCAFAVNILVIFGTENRDARLWSIALVVQSFPYLAALVAACVSGGTRLPEKKLNPIHSVITPPNPLLS